METVALEALAVAGCAALAFAANAPRRRASTPRRNAAVPSTRRLIRALPHRHRRAARAIADLAGECLARHAEGSFEAFTAAETLRTYLPETIAAFLAVPPGYRKMRRGDRPSADDELSRQFDTLSYGLMRIVEADATAGTSRLAANGTFLDERFGAAPKRRPLTPVQALSREFGDLLAGRFAEFIKR